MEIQLFNNPQFGQVRTAGTPDNPLFCLADICRAVELTNPSTVKARLDPEDVQLIDLHALNGGQEIVGNSMATFISEAGAYEVILFSSSPKVRPFRRWLTKVVIPSIRRTGGYIHAKPDETPEEIMARGLMIAKDTIDRLRQREQILQGENRMLLQENKTLAPKAEYADRVLQAPGNYTHSELGKELGFRSWKDFVNELKKRGIMYRSPGGMYQLYAEYCGKGYTATRTAVYNTATGEGKDTYTVWTEKGRMFLHKLFDVDLPAIDLSMFDLTKDN